MQTYEISVDLIDSGKTLNLLVAANDQSWAEHEAACMLRDIGLFPVKHYDLRDGFRVRLVNVTPVFHDFWQAA